MPRINLPDIPVGDIVRRDVPPQLDLRTRQAGAEAIARGLGDISDVTARFAGRAIEKREREREKRKESIRQEGIAKQRSAEKSEAERLKAEERIRTHWNKGDFAELVLARDIAEQALTQWESTTQTMPTADREKAFDEMLTGYLDAGAKARAKVDPEVAEVDERQSLLWRATMEARFRPKFAAQRVTEANSKIETLGRQLVRSGQIVSGIATLGEIDLVESERRKLIGGILDEELGNLGRREIAEADPNTLERLRETLTEKEKVEIGGKLAAVFAQGSTPDGSIGISSDTRNSFLKQIDDRIARRDAARAKAVTDALTGAANGSLPAPAAVAAVTKAFGQETLDDAGKASLEAALGTVRMVATGAIGASAGYDKAAKKVDDVRMEPGRFGTPRAKVSDFDDAFNEILKAKLNPAETADLLRQLSMKTILATSASGNDPSDAQVKIMRAWQAKYLSLSRGLPEGADPRGMAQSFRRAYREVEDFFEANPGPEIPGAQITALLARVNLIAGEDVTAWEIQSALRRRYAINHPKGTR